MAYRPLQPSYEISWLSRRCTSTYYAGVVDEIVEPDILNDALDFTHRTRY